MQALWLAFDEIAGKGIDIFFVLKFLGYLSLILTPTALPIGILLSSIMALGNLSENYEFAAIKSAGVSLRRVMKPLVIFTLLLSAMNFVFLNNVYPWATLKQKNLYLNMKKKKPALALVPGAFNTEIPGISIKFAEKYGEEENLLRDVQISDLSAGNGKVKVITAERGEIATEPGSKYMTLKLEDGYYYEAHVKKSMSRDDRAKNPGSKANFKNYSINIDISAFNDDQSLDKEDITTAHGMLSARQLDSISKEKKITYDQRIESQAKYIYLTTNVNKMYNYPDSLRAESLEPEILDNYNTYNKTLVLNDAVQSVKRIVRRSSNQIESSKRDRKILNLYDYEYGYRIAFSLACVVLFFIGAPLGSIIRKGGFGLPMIMAIIIFVIYFFISQLGKNLSEESAISAQLGSWLATLILLPFGFLLTRRATQGMGVFNIDNFFNKVKKYFSKLSKLIPSK